ncbi:alpha-amylase family protein [Intrasporangium calvum]|uniref:Alpha amylase catalytic region n=1 Tax=Intrasporangium calvum (strain ATCC 23552 / DSM 43043 / JCM 3097 / NBRC 12989 / NCIMB 10167 / NRRL B-3866 / 7 KIP) TaxID=710696 RepID=E6S8M9_INTC7|nr:alpha-amylase family protein [Intrasporangium calvum]ADU46998.1 alpha amylase catalytic region [Intrasporangium calvum DSM 43043]
MTARWYRSGVIYSLDVRLFQDSNGDGIGDLAGLTSRLDHLSRLGVSILWLNPIHPTPFKDGGYDVADYYDVDPALGNLGDFAEFMAECDERGIRVMLDLVLNHTSDEHPWFQAARSDPDSPYRDWYVWSEEEPPDRDQGMVFPGVQESTWSYDETAGAWYHHRFYAFQPDLNVLNPQVRSEMKKIVTFWERLGVSGFRLDGAPFLIEKTTAEGGAGRDHGFLVELRDRLSWLRGDAVFLAEAHVPNDQLLEFFGDADGAASRVQMLFAFRLNEALMLSLARQAAGAIEDALTGLPPLPRNAAWATFLRNHDEVDLSQLTGEERADVFAAFGPEPDHQLYERGIRRRLAPMLGGDEARLRLAYSLQFTMPGTPVLRYGDEIGMGENLDLPERDAIRTPMQWSGTENGGFSTARQDRLIRPVVDLPPFGFKEVNVTDQRLEPNSLLTWFERMLHTLRECEEIGAGTHRIIGGPPPAVLVHVAEGPTGVVMFVHNLGDTPQHLELDDVPLGEQPPVEVFSDHPYEGELDPTRLDVAPYGFRWLRLRRSHGPAPG